MWEFSGSELSNTKILRIWLIVPLTFCTVFMFPARYSSSKMQLAFSHELLNSRDSKGHTSTARNPNCPIFGEKDPIPGLARTVKELGGNDDVQNMNCC